MKNFINFFCQPWNLMYFVLVSNQINLTQIYQLIKIKDEFCDWIKYQKRCLFFLHLFLSNAQFWQKSLINVKRMAATAAYPKKKNNAHLNYTQHTCVNILPDEKILLCVNFLISFHFDEILNIFSHRQCYMRWFSTNFNDVLNKQNSHVLQNTL